MKGMIFTEFMGMVENRWSLDMVDTIIARSGVPSGGAYTAVGTYPHEELVALVMSLSQESGIQVPDLIRAYGQHLFGRFADLYPRFFEDIKGCFHFLSGIEDIIHAEVRKLYPDADLPTFKVSQAPGRMELAYFSTHPFADLAQGLIEGCLAHFGEDITLTREPGTELGGAQARFTLVARGQA